MNKTKDKKIVSIDLDGTLFASYNVITKESIAILKKLVKLGHYVVINTGRGSYEVHELIKKHGLGIEKKNVYYAVTNGAQLWNNMDLIYDVKLDKCAVEVIDFFKEKDFFYIVNCGKEYFSNRKSWMVDVWKMWGNEVAITQKNPSEIAQIVAVKLRSDGEFSSNEYNYLINKYKDKIKFFWQTDLPYKDRTVTCLSLGPMGVDKSVPLKRLAKEKNISVNNIIAFGDSFNDEEMLIYAGQSFAMKNAPNEIQAISKYTTTYNNYEDGVGRTLAELFKEELKNV